PTRVLDIGQNDAPQIRLVVTSELPKQDLLQYVALSHCWGGLMNMRLLVENYTAMKNSITVADLPQTFQDAISITRGIGIQYLWIDSLCILQDAPDDWTRESATMGLVYANAICTVSATAANNSEKGCFFPKKQFFDDPSCILRRQRGFSLVVRSSIQQQVPVVTEMFNEFVEQAPVTTRAWTFQERVLTSRILHFCDGFVFFECNTLRASEYHVDGVPYPRRSNVRTEGALVSATQVPQFGTISEPQQLEFHKSWYEMVERYSIRNLTEQKDKVMAIAGVGDFIQHCSGLKFVAGLWEEILPFNLLWTLEGSPDKRPSRSVPTWSWASVNGTI
ncbi:heterokaryon incompatibility protein-domain-containing protein, partial [Kalaharituber pfeilii]